MSTSEAVCSKAVRAVCFLKCKCDGRGIGWWPWLWHMHPAARSTTSGLFILAPPPWGPLGHEFLPFQHCCRETQSFAALVLSRHCYPTLSFCPLDLWIRWVLFWLSVRVKRFRPGSSWTPPNVSLFSFAILISQISICDSSDYTIPTWKSAQCPQRLNPSPDKLNCWNWRGQKLGGEFRRDPHLDSYCLISQLGFWGLEKWQCVSELLNPNLL